MENNNETEYNKENVDYIQNAKKYIKEVLKEKEEQIMKTKTKEDLIELLDDYLIANHSK